MALETESPVKRGKMGYRPTANILFFDQLARGMGQCKTKLRDERRGHERE